MSSGYYPLDPSRDSGAMLAKVRDDLKDLLDKRGGFEQTAFVASWNNDVPEDAAADAHYESYLFMALELINRCFPAPKDEVAQLRYLVETLLDNEPDDLIADGGVTVLDAWRNIAATILGRSPKKGSFNVRIIDEIGD